MECYSWLGTLCVLLAMTFVVAFSATASKAGKELDIRLSWLADSPDGVASPSARPVSI
jgi:hypothetical protein